MTIRTCARFSGEARMRVAQIGFPAVVDLNVGTSSRQESVSVRDRQELDAMDFRELFERARQLNATVVVRKLELAG